MSIFDRIKAEITEGTVIHREWRVKELVTELRIRRDEFALVYTMPGGHDKDIKESEWNKAYNQLIATGCFSRPWFRKNMEKCNGRGSCNFNAIGGVFSVMGIARCAGRGKGMYLKIAQSSR